MFLKRKRTFRFSVFTTQMIFVESIRAEASLTLRAGGLSLHEVAFQVPEKVPLFPKLNAAVIARKELRIFGWSLICDIFALRAGNHCEFDITARHKIFSQARETNLKEIKTLAEISLS